MALTPVVLNPGAGGSQIQTDKIGGDSYEVVKVAFGSEGVATMVDVDNPLPVAAVIDTTGLATSANQDTEIAALASIAAEDFATQATLAALLAKVIAAPSTEAKQDAMISLLTTIAAITQPLTNTQLRLTPVPISGTVAVTGAGDASAANQTLQITQETAINTVLGAIADAIVAAGAAGSVSAKLRRATQGLEDLKTLIVLAAGTNIIGKVGIDQTTPGTTNGVQVNNTVTTTESVATTIFNGKTTVTTAGTRVVLAASQAVKSVIIKALSTNSGIIYVGNATVAASNGFELLAGDTVSMDIANLNTVNIDSSINTQSVTYIGIN